MAEELTQETGSMEGQATEGTQGIETTQAAPEGVEGQSSAGDNHGTTDTSDSQGQAIENSFFDPKTIEDKPELMAAYKQMQGAFTKGMQGVSGSKSKVEAYDAFYQDPVGSVQRIAQQYGYQLSRAGDQPQSSEEQNPNADPQTWDDVYKTAEDRAEKRIMEKIAPLLGQVQQMRKATIETQLSEIDPTWQQYEDGMKATLSQHPTLANDPTMLYRMSVPPEVLESRAVQKALKSFETKAQSSKVSGQSTTTKQPGTGIPNEKMSFQDSVSFAKKQLAEQGIRPG